MPDQPALPPPPPKQAACRDFFDPAVIEETASRLGFTPASLYERLMNLCDDPNSGVALSAIKELRRAIRESMTLSGQIEQATFTKRMQGTAPNGNVVAIESEHHLFTLMTKEIPNDQRCQSLTPAQRPSDATPGLSDVGHALTAPSPIPADPAHPAGIAARSTTPHPRAHDSDL